MEGGPVPRVLQGQLVQQCHFQADLCVLREGGAREGLLDLLVALMGLLRVDVRREGVEVQLDRAGG